MNDNHINQHLANCLKNRQTVTPGLCFVKDFLPQELLAELLNYINTTNDWKPYNVPSQKNRNVIQGSELLARLYPYFDRITPQIKYIFRKPKLILEGITLWQDKYKYYISKHTDNPEIEVAIQIYLSNNSYPLATTFVIEGQDVQPEYQVNSGYIMDNAASITHYLWPPVPQEELRHSLHIIWKLDN
jgi:hypothetical protein